MCYTKVVTKEKGNCSVTDKRYNIYKEDIKMAVPFRRVSSTRRNKRRTHDKLSAPTLVVCPECGEYKMSHRVCKHCGTYKGVKVK